jgi:hypothetical protein
MIRRMFGRWVEAAGVAPGITDAASGIAVADCRNDLLVIVLIAFRRAYHY